MIQIAHSTERSRAIKEDEKTNKKTQPPTKPRQDIEVGG